VRLNLLLLLQLNIQLCCREIVPEVLQPVNSGVTRGLSQGGNLPEKGPLANTQNDLQSDGESGCGWLY